MNEKIYPLAAMSQAAQLGLMLAKTGTCDEKLLQTQVDSLFVFSPKNAHDIYGSINNLGLGVAYLHFA